MRFNRQYVLIGVGVLLVASLLIGGFSTNLIPYQSNSTNDTAQGSETSGQIRFQNVADEVGLNYTYVVESKQGKNDNAGVYAADYNNDGWEDLLAVGGNHPVLFQNEDGNFQPSNALPPLNRSITVQSALFIDYNDDGWEDLLLLRKGQSPLLLENDRGTFKRVGDAGFDRPLNNSIGATAADFNQDGCLDVFVIQYGEFSRDGPKGLENAEVPPRQDNGNPNALYWGDCSSFKRAAGAGIQGNHWGLVTSAVDFNGDGRIDIHVANDFNHDLIYINRGDGTFDRRLLNEQTDRNAMSSAIGDVDGNGRPDIFVTNIWFPSDVREKFSTAMGPRSKGNNLLINQGNGTFVDRAEEYDVRKGGWGWAAVFANFDNDQDRDLFHTTLVVPFSSDPQFSTQEAILLTSNYTFYTRPVIGERTSDGFTRLSPYSSGGAGFNKTDGRGVAVLDFDNDGDLDLAVGNGPVQVDGNYRLYENVGAAGNALQLRIATSEGAPAVGAYVTVTSEGDTRHRWVHSRTDYFSQSSRMLHVGLGTASRANVTVDWQNGPERTFEDLEANKQYILYPNGTIAENQFAETS